MERRIREERELLSEIKYFYVKINNWEYFKGTRQIGKKYPALKRYFKINGKKGFFVIQGRNKQEKFDKKFLKLLPFYFFNLYNREKQRMEEKIHYSLLKAQNFLTSMDLKDVLREITNLVLPLFGAERASIFRYNKDKRVLTFYTFSKGDKELKTLEFSDKQGIAGWVVRFKKPAVVNDLKRDKRFYPHIDRSFGFSTRSVLAVPLLLKNRVIGVFEILNKKKGEFKKEDLEILERFSSLVAIALENINLYQDLENLFLSFTRAIANAVEAKDPYTSGHVERVEEWAILLGRNLNMNSSEMNALKLASILHDVGKIAIPDSILKKPERLTEEEYDIIKTHVIHSKRILEPIYALQDALPGILHHHERYDGKGYPDGLKGKRIPLIARIISIVDSFDAMTEDRPYRKALPAQIVVNEFQKNKGKQFDPELVDIFLSLPKIKNFLKERFFDFK